MSRAGRPIVIFGLKSFSGILRHGLEHDAGREVAGYVVDGAYLTAQRHEGLPVVAFEQIGERFPPEHYALMLPLGHRDMHALRRSRFQRALALGYELPNFVSSRASVYADLTGCRNVMVYEQAIVQAGVTLGDDVTIRAGANIGHDSVLHAHCSVASGVVTGGRVVVGECAWLGLGAVVNNRVRIAERCFVGAGAVVVSDTEPEGVYVGVPARRMAGRTAMDVASAET